MKITQQQYQKIANIKRNITVNISYWLSQDQELLQHYAARLVRTGINEHIKRELGISSLITAPQELYEPICDLLNSYSFRYGNKEYKFSTKSQGIKYLLCS